MRKSINAKLAVLLIMAALLIGGTIGGTVAYLIAESETVTNTFTVGNITLSLTETWNADSDDTDTEPDHWEGKIIPGGKDSKDPKLTVSAGSEECYVYVSIDNNVVLNSAVVATPNIDTTKWKQVGTVDNKVLYRYKESVNASSAAVELPVFTEVTYANTITKSDITTLTGKTIKITGYAHQSANTDQATADAAAKGWAGISN